MSLIAQINAGITAIFDAFDDIPTSCTFTDLTGGTYDPSTDTIVDTTSTTVTECFVLGFTQEEKMRNAEIADKDKKIIVNATNISVQAQVNDTVTAGGVTYEIKGVSHPVDGVGLMILWASPKA